MNSPNRSSVAFLRVYSMVFSYLMLNKSCQRMISFVNLETHFVNQTDEGQPMKAGYNLINPHSPDEPPNCTALTAIQI